MLLSSRRAGTPRCGALVVPLLCCDGRDTIQGRWAGSVKDLRPRFTHTDIRAGQRHLGDLGASLRCRHWERSQASAAPSSVRTLRPGPTAWWSLVIDSTCQVCATRPHLSLLTKSRRTPTVHIPRHTPTDRACPPIPGPPPTRPGTFRAAGRVSLRPGAFDAVGDGNPVPERAGCPRLGESVPAHAECPPACQRALGDTAYVGRTQCRAPSAESVAPVPADGDRQHHHRRHHLRPRSLAHIVTIGDN